MVSEAPQGVAQLSYFAPHQNYKNCQLFFLTEIPTVVACKRALKGIITFATTCLHIIESYCKPVIIPTAVSSHHFPIIFPSFSHHVPIMFPSCSQYFPIMFPSFSHQVPIMLPWFSIMFPRFSHHVPIMFPSCSHGFPISFPSFQSFPMIFPSVFRAPGEALRVLTRVPQVLGHHRVARALRCGRRAADAVLQSRPWGSWSSSYPNGDLTGFHMI